MNALHGTKNTLQNDAPSISTTGFFTVILLVAYVRAACRVTCAAAVRVNRFAEYRNIVFFKKSVFCACEMSQQRTLLSFFSSQSPSSTTAAPKASSPNAPSAAAASFTIDENASVNEKQSTIVGASAAGVVPRVTQSSVVAGKRAASDAAAVAPPAASRATAAVTVAAAAAPPPAKRVKSASAAISTTNALSSMSARAQEAQLMMKDHYAWLREDKIVDAHRRRPNDPEYDPRTVYIPAMAKSSFTNFEKQYWDIKSKHMDKLFFKKGKFYEMFEGDADIGARWLGLKITTRGKMRMAGVPFSMYAGWARKLLAHGFKVARVDEVSTRRGWERSLREASGTAAANASAVIRRELVEILTQGTIVDETLLTDYAATYLIVLKEQPCAPSLAAASGDELTSAVDAARVGVCIVDASVSRFMFTEFEDDAARAKLETLFAQYPPKEIVCESGNLSALSDALVRRWVPSERINRRRALDEFWTPDMLRDHVSNRQLFGVQSDALNKDAAAAAAAEAGGGVARSVGRNGQWPAVLSDLPSDSLALAAVAGCAAYLSELKLDHVFSRGQFELYDARYGGVFMTLDGRALADLDVLRNSSDGTRAGTLIEQIDFCVTPMGRRRLQQWLCRPLRRVVDIHARLDAVDELRGNHELRDAVQAALARLGDVERMLARVHATTASLRDFLKLLNAFEQMLETMEALQGDTRTRAKCALLAQLLSHGDSTATAAATECGRNVDVDVVGDTNRSVPPSTEMGVDAVDGVDGSGASRSMFADDDTLTRACAAHLRAMRTHFDWEDAAATDTLTPHNGASDDYDAASERVAALDAALAQHLREQRAHFGDTTVRYLDSGKNLRLLAVKRETLRRKPPPPDFELISETAAERRFYNATLRKLVSQWQDAAEDRAIAVSAALCAEQRAFGEHRDDFAALTKRLSDLDCLLSLARAADAMAAPKCRPQLAERGGGNSGAPFFRATQMRHACLASRVEGTFIANDLRIGRGDQCEDVILLTGPNMGGKSTLLRQTCLIAIMAQIGSYVPAESCTLTPVDRVFTRIGASDNLLAGQSTFLTELLETSEVLRNATSDSLVILDELGRGTSTRDGESIASAVLGDLSARIQCRTMFSTHLHMLSDEADTMSNVCNKHMACAADDARRRVTFLYKVRDGACPRSYGMHVAQMAGVPAHVVQRAEQIALDLEAIPLLIRNVNKSLRGLREKTQS